jgi:hypothetical protein
MVRFVIVGLGSGLVFAVMDVLVNANPLGRSLYEAYKPLARESVNGAAGMVIDLIYGLILAGAFLILYASLPGDLGLLKGLSYALLLWVLRVLMYVVTHWMTLKIPVPTLLYTLVTGLVEMAVLGVLYGLLLKPWV